MKRAAAKQVLAAAATLPAGMARRVAAAIQTAAKDQTEPPDPADLLETAAAAMDAALGAALLEELAPLLATNNQ